MSDVREIDAAIATTTPSDVDLDRRRPDRAASVSPALLPLLRAPEHVAEPPSDPAPLQEFGEDFQASDPDDDDPARGIMFAILFSLPVWAIILYLVL